MWAVSKDAKEAAKEAAKEEAPEGSEVGLLVVCCRFVSHTMAMNTTTG